MNIKLKNYNTDGELNNKKYDIQELRKNPKGPKIEEALTGEKLIGAIEGVEKMVLIY